MRNRRRRGGALAAAIAAGLAGAGLGARRGGTRDPGSLARGAALGLGFGLALPAAAATFTVTTTGDPGPSGTLSLREAVDDANASMDPANSIVFASGVTGTITLLQGTMNIGNYVSIEGPGASRLAVSGNDASSIFFVSGTVVSIQGLTLTHSYAPSLGLAAITAQGVLYVRDCVVTDNLSVDGPAGIKMGPGSLTVTNTTISNNRSPNIGSGGLEASDAMVTIADSEIVGNTAGTGGFGGGAGFLRSTLTMTRSEVSGNAVPCTGGGTCYGGGGLALVATNAVIGDSKLIGNETGANGGGIAVRDQAGSPVTVLTVTGSTIEGNVAAGNGGGIYVANAAGLDLTHSLVSGNSANGATGAGGGLWLGATGTAEIADSTLYGNYAYGGGGGIAIADPATGNGLAIVRTTIVGNATFGNASNGISGAGLVVVDSSVVANNFSHYSQQDLTGAFDASYSLIRTPGTAIVSGSGNLASGLDPLLGNLAENGGPTRSLLPAPASPLIDAANPGIASGTDQRGLPRVFGGRADIGAIERQDPEDVIFIDGFESS